MEYQKLPVGLSLSDLAVKQLEFATKIYEAVERRNALGTLVEKQADKLAVVRGEVSVHGIAVSLTDLDQQSREDLVSAAMRAAERDAIANWELLHEAVQRAVRMLPRYEEQLTQAAAGTLSSTDGETPPPHGQSADDDEERLLFPAIQQGVVNVSR